MPKISITGSYGRLSPSFLRNCHMNFQSVAQFALPPALEECSPYSTSSPARAVTCVLFSSIQRNVSWNLIVISLMAKDVEHFFKCFSAPWDSSGENSPFISVLHFLIGLFSLLISSFLGSLYILEISPLSDMGLVKIFSHSVLILVPALLVSSSGSFLRCQCVQSYFLLSLLSGSVCLD